MNQKQMIEAYVKTVSKQLPLEQRKDIEAELRGLIEDELQTEGETVEAVLIKLGHPSLLAERYTEKKRHLIGPMYINQYYGLLQILIPVVWLGLIIATIVRYIFHGDVNFFGLIPTLFSSAVTIFGFVTLIFMGIDRATRKQWGDTPWHPKDLSAPKEEHNKYGFSHTEIVIGIALLTILLTVLNTYPQLIAVYSLSEPRTSVPLLNVEQFRPYLLWINIAILVDIIRLVIKWLIGEYSLKHAIVNTSLNAVTTIVSVVVILQAGFINPDLNQALANIGFSADNQATLFLSRILLVVAILMVVGLIADSIKDFYRALNHNREEVLQSTHNKPE